MSHIEKPPAYQEIALESAINLLKSLSPTSDNLPDYQGCRWVFRGQRDAKWNLLPSAFRPRTLLCGSSADTFASWTNREQAKAEFDAVYEFFTKSDECGLRLPEDNQQLRFELVDLRSRVFAESTVAGTKTEAIEWPPRSLWSLFALAQHYGIPTRLLDWTRHAYIATYFAAINANSTSEHVAIWAYSAAEDFPCRTLPAPDGNMWNVHTVTAPYAENANLSAQLGVHMVLSSSGALILEQPASRPSWEQILPVARRSEIDQPQLLKFTLQTSEARTLLKLLAKYRVTAATLFPGYAGVVRAMQEEQSW